MRLLLYEPDFAEKEIKTQKSLGNREAGIWNFAAWFLSIIINNYATAYTELCWGLIMKKYIKPLTQSGLSVKVGYFPLKSVLKSVAYTCMC